MKNAGQREQTRGVLIRQPRVFSSDLAPISCPNCWQYRPYRIERTIARSPRLAEMPQLATLKSAAAKHPRPTCSTALPAPATNNSARKSRPQPTGPPRMETVAQPAEDVRRNSASSALPMPSCREPANSFPLRALHGPGKNSQRQDHQPYQVWQNHDCPRRSSSLRFSRIFFSSSSSSFSFCCPTASTRQEINSSPAGCGRTR